MNVPRSLALRLLLVVVVLGVSLLAVVVFVRGSSVNSDRLDGLAPGYEVVAVSDVDCGQGAVAICSRAFEISYTGTEEDLIRELQRLDVVESDDGSNSDAFLSESDPGRAVLVLFFVDRSPHPIVFLLWAFMLLAFIVASIWLLGVVSFAAVRRARNSLPSRVGPDR